MPSPCPWRWGSSASGRGGAVGKLERVVDAQGADATADDFRLMVEEGARVAVADAFEPVVAALTASPTMSRAIETARALVRELGQRGVPDLALARQLRRLRDFGVHLEDAGQT